MRCPFQCQLSFFLLFPCLFWGRWVVGFRYFGFGKLGQTAHQPVYISSLDSNFFGDSFGMNLYLAWAHKRVGLGWSAWALVFISSSLFRAVTSVTRGVVHDAERLAEAMVRVYRTLNILGHIQSNTCVLVIAGQLEMICRNKLGLPPSSQTTD